MTRDEMRFIRREFINVYLQDFKPFARINPLHMMKIFVRMAEVTNYGTELQSYAGNWQDVT